MKITKEELIKKVAVLESENKALNDFQTKQLKEMAKAFGWRKSGGIYTNSYNEIEPLTPTWGEVFIQIGKLLASQKAIDSMEYINAVDYRLGDVEAKIKKLLTPPKE